MKPTATKKQASSGLRPFQLSWWIWGLQFKGLWGCRPDNTIRGQPVMAPTPGGHITVLIQDTFSIPIPSHPKCELPGHWTPCQLRHSSRETMYMKEFWIQNSLTRGWIVSCKILFNTLANWLSATNSETNRQQATTDPNHRQKKENFPPQEITDIKTWYLQIFTALGSLKLK